MLVLCSPFLIVRCHMTILYKTNTLPLKRNDSIGLNFVCGPYSPYLWFLPISWCMFVSRTRGSSPTLSSATQSLTRLNFRPSSRHIMPTPRDIDPLKHFKFTMGAIPNLMITWERNKAQSIRVRSNYILYMLSSQKQDQCHFPRFQLITLACENESQFNQLNIISLYSSYWAGSLACYNFLQGPAGHN